MDPELTGRAEGISGGKLPHPREELSKATVEEGHANYEVGDEDVASMDVVEGENQGRRRKTEKAPAEIELRGIVSGRAMPDQRRRTRVQGSQDGSGFGGEHRPSQCQTWLEPCKHFKSDERSIERRGKRSGERSWAQKNQGRDACGGFI